MLFQGGFWCPKTFLLGSDSTAFRFLQLIDQDSQVAPFHEQLNRKTWGRLLRLAFSTKAFVFFMVTSSWTLLSILTAVVSENMISTTSGQEKEILLMSLGMGFKERIGKISFMGSWGTIRN